MPNIDITSLGINANREVEVKTVVDEPPLRFFREVVSLRFTTGRMADRIAIQNNDDEIPTFTGVFNYYDYSLASPTESLTLSDEAVIVTLDAPRQVREIHLSADTTSDSKYSLEFYRLDGNTLSESPTATVTLEDNVATLPTDPDFTDIRFAIRLKDSNGQLVALKTSDIVAIQLRSYPTGPRLGIAPIATSESEDSDDLVSPIFFFQMPGEIREATSGQGEFSVGRELADALERHLDEYFALLQNDQAGGSQESSVPDTVEVDLIIESDAQCVLEITDFNIPYRPVVQSFPSTNGEKLAKQILRFHGDHVSGQEVLLQLPRNATVTSAVLKTVESFQSDRPFAPSDGGAWTSLLTQNQGIFLGVEKWVAQETTSAQAILASGIGLGLMSLAEKTELLLELREDWQGQPSGKKLADGTITLEHVGRRAWTSLRFAEAVVIPSKTHWIVTKAASGAALWLAQISGSDVRILEKDSQRNGWTERKGADIQALYRLFCKTSDALSQQQPVTLTIGEQEVSGTRNENSDGMFDLKEALNDFLNMQPVDIATVTVPLTFTAVVPGIITVYPPSIEIDI